MKNFPVLTVLAFAFSMAAGAQTNSPNLEPSGTNPSTQPRTTPSQTPDISNPGQTPRSESKKNEKSLKGCIQSSGVGFTLEDKHGKQIALTGSQDFVSHVGHTVTVRGTYGGGPDASSAASASSSASMPASGDQFMVSKLDVVSEKCSAPKSKTNSKALTNDSGKPSPNHLK